MTPPTQKCRPHRDRYYRLYISETLCRARLSAVEKVWMLRHITLPRTIHKAGRTIQRCIHREITRTYKNIFLYLLLLSPTSLCPKTHTQFCQFGNERYSRKYFPPFPKFARGGGGSPSCPFSGRGQVFFLPSGRTDENSVYTTLFFPFSPPHPNFSEMFLWRIPHSRRIPPHHYVELQNTDLFP